MAQILRTLFPIHQALASEAQLEDIWCPVSSSFSQTLETLLSAVPSLLFTTPERDLKTTQIFVSFPREWELLATVL